ncbi:hypothetical protein C8J56DRAFT_909190 [Mycena floridula]|nr:hypothetical protein C8J56DRAFT_909190 [Mycena floridula]
MDLILPQKPLPWNHSASEIVALTKDNIERTRKVQDKVAALPSSDCDYESVFLTLEAADTQFDAVAEPMQFYQHVSSSKDLRDASYDASSLIQDFRIESSMRLDVFQAKKTAEMNIKASEQWEKLSAEEKRLVDKMILDGTRAGLALPEETRNQLSILQKELAGLCNACSKNANEEKGFISFTAEELDDVPKDVVSGYRQRTENGKTLYDVTFKQPDIGPLLKFAKQSSVRQRAPEAYESRLSHNVPLFSKIINLRRQIAKLLGYETWADHVTEIKMVKTAAGVAAFLDGLEQKLKPLGVAGQRKLLVRKQQECKELGVPFDGKFYTWDKSYYERLETEATLSLDDSLVKEFFPVTTVVPAILEIYQTLLSLRFEEVKPADTWHPDVQQFSVWEKDATDETGFIGYCYLDLFPREGKYSHNSVWPLDLGYDLPDGKRNYPSAVIVANLAKATRDTPALMTHWLVVTFFHEMGHVFHELLSQTKFGRFHGTRGPTDYAEAPSQMLENWCWDPRILARISSHYETKEPMPADMIDKLVKSRYSNVGMFYLLQLFYAKFDFQIHVDPETDYTEMWNDMRKSTALVETVTKCPAHAAFGHITGGYDVGYYGYTYSLVFATDMYITMFEADPLNPVRGKLYRDKILKPGASLDEIDILKDFLGRLPDNDAFLKQVFGVDCSC